MLAAHQKLIWINIMIVGLCLLEGCATETTNARAENSRGFVVMGAPCPIVRAYSPELLDRVDREQARLDDRSAILTLLEDYQEMRAQARRCVNGDYQGS